VRLTAEFFAAALVRRAMIEGAFAAVTRKGAAQAGTLFIIVDRLDGTADLYGPAPQMLMESSDSDRRFERLAAGVPRAEVLERLAREQRFDSDLWVIEIEDRAGRCFVEVIGVD
jgi:hypothetical protein